MITENIIVALITGILAVVGSVASNMVLISKKSKQDAIKDAEREVRQSMRLDSIEKKLDIHNGYAEKFGDIQKVSSNVGTTITVKDLFFCVPARAKFLKKNKTEEQEITNIINRVVLAHPEIKIIYIVDGKKVLSSIGSNEKEAMFSVYGKESVKETLEVFAERDGVSVKGFVGKPTYSKSNRTYQTLIIIGRYVSNQGAAFVVAAVIFAVAYGCCLVLLRVFDSDELELLPFGKRLYLVFNKKACGKRM